MTRESRANPPNFNSSELPDLNALPDEQPLETIWRRFGDQLRRRARTRLRQHGLSGHAESMDICNDVMADLARRFQDQPMTPDDALAYVLRRSTIKYSTLSERWHVSAATFDATKEHR